jgi:hypothetical protein
VEEGTWLTEGVGKQQGAGRFTEDMVKQMEVGGV